MTDQTNFEVSLQDTIIGYEKTEAKTSEFEPSPVKINTRDCKHTKAFPAVDHPAN